MFTPSHSSVFQKKYFTRLAEILKPIRLILLKKNGHQLSVIQMFLMQSKCSETVPAKYLIVSRKDVLRFHKMQTF